MSDSSAAPAAPAGPQPSDVASDLTAAWDAQESPDSGNAPASSGKSSSSSSSEAGGKSDDSGTRARGEDGRFAKTNGTATTAPVGEKPDAKPAPRTDAKAEPGARDAKADDRGDAKPAEFKVPEKWPADVKARYESLAKVSPDHAKWMVEEFNKVQAQQGIVNQTRQKLAPIQKIAENVESLLAPGRVQRAAQGIGDADYIRGLVAAGEVLDKNPEQGIRFLAQKYGLDLQKLVNGEAQRAQVPEEVRQLQEENAQIKAFLATQVQATQRQQLGHAMGAIDAFANQKDAQGQPLYPHFDEVIHEVIANVQFQRENGQPINLKSAYDRAVRMNDSVWLKVQGARSETEKRSAEEKRLRDIEEARRAGFTPSGSGGVASEKPADSLRGELERLWENTHR